ncbi:MAG TPA: cupin domain-containing protein [Candidatus Binatia bacterium]|jgi:quercetin dioxygenase-like cupin family protein
MMTEKWLQRFCLLVLVAGGALGFLTIGQRSASAQEGLTRTVIMKKDLEADPKKEVTIFIAEYKPGAKSGKHYHPGQEFIYVLEGNGLMEEAGKAPVDMKPGVELYFQSDPAKPTYVHEATNLSKTAGMKLLVTLITEKGQPLAYPLKQ